MRRLFSVLFATVAIVASSFLAQPAFAAKTLPAPQISFTRFVLSGGTADAGVSNRGGTLSLTGGATDGTWLSPSQDAQLDFDELVASWNATTPTNTWLTA